MASKRASHEEGNDDRDHQVPSKRRHGQSEQAETRTVAINNTMKEQNEIECLFRKVMQEELPIILQRHLSSCWGLNLNRQTGTSGGRALQLCFMNKLPTTIFTLNKIIAEGGAPLQIVLRDATYQHRLVNEGPQSSMKIEICVLNGDFGSEDWNAEEFNAKTVSPRVGKGPLLNGDRFITLENGVGYIAKKIVFTDNSCWTRSGTFRLGVKIVQSTSIGADVREGRTEPFKVKDNRGEVYKKHDCPSLNDEVWRLQKIAKDGKIHKQLSSHGIKTVKDLLQLYITNQASLQEKIGNIARKSWDTIIDHAKACDIDDDKRYIYHCFAAEQLISLVFNCIYEVVEVYFYGQNSRSLESLNLEEKRLVERAKQQAYKNLKDLLPLETTTHGLVKTLAGVQAVQHGATDKGLQQYDFPIARQVVVPESLITLPFPLNAYPVSFNLSTAGQPETWPNLCEPSTSTSHIDEAAHSDHLGSNQLPELGEIPLNLCAEGQFFTGAYTDANGWFVSGSQIDQFASYFSPPIPLEQVNLFHPPCGDGFPNSTVYVSSKGKRKTVWYKIRTALKWVILHVAKRKAKLFHHHHHHHQQC